MSKETRIRIRHHVQRNKGALTRFGYCLHCPTQTRHAAINAAIRSEGATRTARRLSLLETWNRNRHPSSARIAHADHNYVKQHHLM